MAALDTVQDYITAARRLLQDTVATAYRYPDDNLVDALNLALLETRRLRADLFLKQNFTAPSFALPADLTKAVPMNVMYRNALVYFMVGYMQLRDDESTTDSRAAALLGKFQGQLLSVTG